MGDRFLPRLGTSHDRNFYDLDGGLVENFPKNPLMRAVGRIALLASAGFYLYLGHDSHSRDTKPKDPTVAEWLAWCSPFESLDEVRILEFRTSGRSVTIKEAIGGERENGAFAAKNPKISRGT